MRMANSTADSLSLKELLDIPELRDLSKSFTQVTGIPTAVMDLDGNVLLTGQWRSICTNFHRQHPVTSARCRESDTALASRVENGEKYTLYKCKNGLVDVAAPIIIKGEHLGNLFIGQFFLDPPDVGFFSRQAEEFGFDKEAYLQALSDVPVLSVEKIQQAIKYLTNLTGVFAAMGKDKLELYTLNRHLENRIEERTTDLKAEIKVRKKTETELQQSKKFLGSVFNAIQDGISVLDRDLNIVQVNEVMYQWYPHLETAIGEKCYKVYHGRTQPCAVCPALRSLKTRKMERDEVPYTINDGIIGTQELFSFPMVDPAGKVKGVVEYVRDISERKRIEEQVKAEKRFSESLIKSLPGIMYIFDQSGRFLRWNKNLEDVSGYSSEQIGCMSPFDFIAMEDRILVKKSIEKVFQGGRVNVEAGFQTARGDVIPYLFTGYRFDQESANYLVGVGLDISVRVKVEQEKEALIQELQGTLSQIKQLSGLLPICASCKKIRDDKGYWNQIESYIKKHSEAKFSHGICPECARRLYPDLKLWNSIDSE